MVPLLPEMQVQGPDQIRGLTWGVITQRSLRATAMASVMAMASSLMPTQLRAVRVTPTAAAAAALPTLVAKQSPGDAAHVCAHLLLQHCRSAQLMLCRGRLRATHSSQGSSSNTLRRIDHCRQPHRFGPGFHCALLAAASALVGVATLVASALASKALLQHAATGRGLSSQSLGMHMHTWSHRPYLTPYLTCDPISNVANTHSCPTG
jgi:hypothetical protein